MRSLGLDTASLVVPALLVVGAYLGLLWVALAFWMARDARLRSPSAAFAILAALLGLGLPFVGALVYLVIRPPHTLEEERAFELEERALTETPADEAAVRPCPTCGREIEQEFVVCPYCRTRFAQRCHSCQRWLRLGWRICPYCAEEVGYGDLGAAGRAAGS